MHASVDWLQSVHVVFTARRVVGHVTVYIVVMTLVTVSVDDVAVSPDIKDFTVIDVRLTY